MNRLCLAVLAVRCLGAAEVPTYTNDDLDALAPLRHQTGALSQPATPPVASLDSDDATSRAAAERYWRREAERNREKLRAARQQAEELREQIDERRRRPGVRPLTDPQLEAWQRKLEAIEGRIHDTELRFEERARRERALPGWLR